MQTTYRLGQKHGVERQCLSDGALSKETHWANGLNHGALRTWYDNGTLKLYEEWNQGERTSQSQYGSTGDIIVEWHWLNGLKHGTWLRYAFVTIDGELRNVVTDEEDWDQGVLKATRDINFIFTGLGTHEVLEDIYLNGGVDHRMVYRYDGELLLSRFKEVGGVKHGPYDSWHTGGNKYREAHYVAGKLHGLEKVWWSNGNLRSEQTYHHGLRHGLALKWYYECGAPSDVIDYHLGQKHGMWIAIAEPGESLYSYTSGRSYLGTDERVPTIGDIIWLWKMVPIGTGFEEVIYEAYEQKFHRVYIPYSSGVRHGVQIQYWNWPDNLASVTGFEFGANLGTTSYFPSDYRPYVDNVQVLAASKGDLYSKQDPCGNPKIAFRNIAGFPDVPNFGYRSPTSFPPCNPPPVIRPAILIPGTPENDINLTKLHGTVLDEAGAPLEGVTVELVLDGTQTLMTDLNGQFSHTFAHASGSRNVSIRASLPGYQDYVNGSITIAAGQSLKTVNIRLKPIDGNTPGGAGPSIQRFGPSFLGNRSSFGGIFLDTPSQTVSFKAEVDWGAAMPGEVRVRNNGSLTTLPANVNPLQLSYAIPSDFQVSTDPTRNVLTAQAIDMDGKSSSLEVVHPVVLPVPPLLKNVLTEPARLSSGDVQGKRTWTLNAALPNPAIEAEFKREDIPTLIWDLWSLVPFVGGYDTGLAPTQVIVEAGLSSTGEGTLKGGSMTGFKIGGVDMEGAGVVSGNIVYSPYEGWHPSELAVELTIKGALKREIVPSQFPPVGALKTVPFLSGVVQSLDRLAMIEGAVSVLGGGKLALKELETTPGALTPFGELSFGSGLGVDLIIDVGPKLTIGGGGQIVLTAQAPADPDYLKSVVVQMELHGKLQWKLFEVSRTSEITFSYPETPTVQSTRPRFPPTEPAIIRLISREFAAKANYHQFTGGQRIQKQGATAPVEQTLIANAYADAEPAFALNGAAGAIVYVHFDENKPTLQATDIQLLYSADGTFAQAPVPVTDDTRGEFAPTIGFDANGRLVAAWERVKSANFTTDDIAAFAADLEIVYASYDPTAGTWNAPVALTDNTSLDHSPEICRGLNGEILLVWQQNAGLELIGAAAAPTTIYTASWDAAARTFNAPEAAPHSFVDANGFSCAFDGDDFLLVWSRDTDGDPTTSDDFEIEYLSRAGATWGSVVALTDDAVKDVSPTVVYKAADQPELLWVRDGMLVRLTDWMTKTPAEVRADSGGLSFLDFDLFCDGNDRLVTLWSAMDEQGQPNVFYQARDAAADQWSMDRQLTHDEAVEFNLRGALAPDGSFRYVYLNKHPANDVADLIIRTHRISANLSVGAADIITDPERPAPNEAGTLKATVHNTGDLPASGITVAFHDGDPSVNTTPVGTAMLPADLRAGDSATVSVNWIAPASLEGVNIWVVVDNGNALIESDETDNQAMAPLALPDLVVTDIRYSDLNDGSVLLYTTVENIGGVTADVIPIRYLIDGVEYATTTLNRLFPGRNAEFSNRIYGNALFANDIVGGQIEVVVNPDKTLAEYENSDDNRRAIRVHLESDLDQDGMNDQWERLHFGDTLRDGLGDLDNDGMPDRAEYVAGTDPNQATSAIYFGAPNRNPQTGHVHLTWATSPGRTYQAQYTDNLGSQNWQNLGQPFTSSATSSDMTDTNPAAGGQRYYRVVVVGSQP